MIDYKPSSLVLSMGVCAALDVSEVYEDADSEEYSSSDEDIGGDVEKNLENSINKQSNTFN